MNYQIGLDFGTKQTKVCLYNVENRSHKFHRWDNHSYFLPTAIGLTNDGKFLYGDLSNNSCKYKFNYFKMAVLDDDYFHNIVDDDNQFIGVLYNADSFMSDKDLRVEPSFLCTIYIAYILKVIESKYGGDMIPKKSVRFLGNNQDVHNSERNKFTVQMGIPTEWSREINLVRRWKFESILFLAWKLKDSYESLDSFLEAPYEELNRSIFSLIDNNKCSMTDFISRINEIGLSVFPESAAGLYFLMVNRKLEPGGLYATMDLGAGTSDICYFSVTNDYRIGYYASGSYSLACNSIYERYAKRISDSDFIDQIHLVDSEDKVLEMMTGNHDLCEDLDYVLISVFHDVQRLFRLLYTRFVGRFGMTPRWERRPILMYGGGSRFPRFRGGDMEYIVLGGVNALYMCMQEIADFIPDDNIVNRGNPWRLNFPILVVSLGLSYPKPPDENNWVERREEDAPLPLLPVEVPHPFNEDCYIYDWRLRS